MNRICFVFSLLLIVTPLQMSSAGFFVPPGLQPGAQFQLAFITSGTIAGTSSDIQTYNDFVQAQASMNSALTGTSMGVQWKAIISTPSANANMNAVSTSSVPVYLLNGVLLDDDGLYGGDLNNRFSITQNLTDLFEVDRGLRVWTGSTESGDGFNVGLGNERVLGGTPRNGRLRVGRMRQTDSRWIDQGNEEDAVELPVYALSSVLVVEVPEPASGLSLLAGLVSFSLLRLRRR